MERNFFILIKHKKIVASSNNYVLSTKEVICCVTITGVYPADLEMTPTGDAKVEEICICPLHKVPEIHSSQ